MNLALAGKSRIRAARRRRRARGHAGGERPTSSSCAAAAARPKVRRAAPCPDGTSRSPSAASSPAGRMSADGVTVPCSSAARSTAAVLRPQHAGRPLPARAVPVAMRTASTGGSPAPTWTSPASMPSTTCQGPVPLDRPAVHRRRVARRQRGAGPNLVSKDAPVPAADRDDLAGEGPPASVRSKPRLVPLGPDQSHQQHSPPRTGPVDPRLRVRSPTGRYPRHARAPGVPSSVGGDTARCRSARAHGPAARVPRRLSGRSRPARAGHGLPDVPGRRTPGTPVSTDCPCTLVRATWLVGMIRRPTAP